MVENIRNIVGKSGIKVATVLDGQWIGEKSFWQQGTWMKENGEMPPFWNPILSQLFAVTDNRTIFTEIGEIFVENIRPQPRMVICGAGHISIPLIQMANILEFNVTVFEDRPLFADHARKAGAAEVICESFAAVLDREQGDESTYYVIVTRGHRYDTLCLMWILKKTYAYVGMIGSKGRVAKTKELLLEQGYEKEALEALHSPIGLKIKAETPAEIAVSILSEVIQVKNERQSATGYTKKIMQYFAEEWTEGSRFAMVTIISRTGSAPRGVGTKMLVLEDGRMIGTIGGGCVEAEIRNLALESIREQTVLVTSVDLTQKEAEEEGMACGGRIRILIEGK